MVIDEWDFEKNESLRFKIRLLIRHPNIDPDRITRTLQLTPHLSAMMGSVRKGPKGAALPGLHKDSVWSHSFRVERNRFFFSDAVKLIDKLEPHRAFLVEIDKSGGSISMVLDLPGDTNIGDVFPWREMARLCDLRINLSIEVFPEFN
jgi:hypothetical protein